MNTSSHNSESLTGELRNIQEAVRNEGLDGWLFCNFRRRDVISDAVLHIPVESSNSRMWVYAVPALGDPLKIVHAIEKDILDHLAGTKVTYISREEFINALKPLAGKKWGVHSSENLPSVSYLSEGTARVFEKAGLILKSAESLIQRFAGLLDKAGIESHEKAAKDLYEIVELAWERLKKRYKDKTPLYEEEIRRLMLEEFNRRNLITHHPPMVCFGENTANPHYDFSGQGKLLRDGDTVQFDLWAKEKEGKTIYADISWAGVASSYPRSKEEKVFSDLISVRENTYRFIEQEFSAMRPITGAMVDLYARKQLNDLGYRSEIKHRTGHGIDTECHGSGVNMDCIEFPDERFILEGSCFSLEPGLYFSDFGFRTEINVYISDGKPVISGKNRQYELLSC